MQIKYIVLQIMIRKHGETLTMEIGMKWPCFFRLCAAAMLPNGHESVAAMSDRDPVSARHQLILS